ncbi:restriction endonuclease subunit S [Chloroflexota bacterium]
MKLVKLENIFHIKYGNQCDFNKMLPDPLHGINFVSRSRNNLGIIAKVKKLDLEPFPEGTITVSLGGTYLLSSFVQPEPFYTAQNIKVLFPKESMVLYEKLFYCKCIELNRYKYASHGREANITLDSLLVPDKSSIPSWVDELQAYEKLSEAPKVENVNHELKVKDWKWFMYSDLFIPKRGENKNILGADDKWEVVQVISATKKNNGVIGYSKKDKGKPFPANCITVANTGQSSVGYASFHEKPFYATNNITVLIPNFECNIYIGLFICALIQKDRYRYSFGRVLNENRVKAAKIRFPVDKDDNPDWQFVENYIKSLPYSSNL